ncbi:CYTH domain-containing protein [Peribacillus frigoritolerans]|uniref:CYTH domain-containing protein n=1 Tax=Peribacillus frigoritolerans TaxID=450367 RepID=UPI00105A944A|nr:CYTH domain-containing protein [Peribacillus frigoritolerans]TDL80629.1 CYTH domain-containing protein [Peribacillus frigoritolerans]
MTQEIEIEYKNLLTKEEFSRLADFFHIADHDFKHQDNHYFDTPEFHLKERGAALRIRFKNGRYVLTLKEPAPVGLLETHQEITAEQASELISSASSLPKGKVLEQIHSLGIHSGNISFFGTLSTNRAEKTYKNGLIVLDHSRYINKEDYEIEYEVLDAEEGLLAFRELLASQQVPLRKTPNKIKRFMTINVRSIMRRSFKSGN